jgi:catalase
MSNKDKTHQSPIHGTEESQPGMDSLAPADGSHRLPGPSAQANSLPHREA